MIHLVISDVHTFYNLYVVFNATATTEIYTYCHPLSLNDALPMSADLGAGGFEGYLHLQHHLVLRMAQVDREEHRARNGVARIRADLDQADHRDRSEEHTSELQTLMRISYTGFCVQKTDTSDSSESHHSSYEQSNTKYNTNT